jgi:hypothetical protein
MFQIKEGQVAGCAEMAQNGSDLIQKQKLNRGKKKQQFLKYGYLG